LVIGLVKGFLMRCFVLVSLQNRIATLALSLAVSACLCIPLPEARAQTTLSVDSTSDIFLSGRSAGEVPAGTHPGGPGSLPPSVALSPGTSRVLRFLSVSGSMSYNNTDAPAPYLGQFNGPDGGAVWFADSSFPTNFLTTSGTPGLISPGEGSPTTFYVDMDSFGGISGMKLFESDPNERRVMFLSGVFLDDNDPISLTAPSRLDFSSTSLGRSFSSLAPELQQTFYIGDGLTGEGTGSVQTFWVPDSATRLFLGIVDGAYFVGGPDYYDNNAGSFSATFTVATVPELGLNAFAGAISLLLGSLAFLERRRASPQGT
jgi:hypothetical protein